MPRSNDDPRRQVQILPERIGAVSNSEFPGHYPGEDHSWNLQKFEKDLTVSIQRLTPTEIEFDLVGVDASIANALRRVMIAEVPTMAIEQVYVYNNTSIMQDEVLCHRLGLVPLKVDPRKMSFRPSNSSAPPLVQDTLVFNLRVRCDRIPGTRGETDPKRMYYDSNVYTGMLEFQDTDGQTEKRFDGVAPRPVVDDVLLVKLRPGQVVDMFCFAHKGIGADHAKFSPVATASYRLLPHIQLRGPIPREHQAKFVSCFAPGVVAIEDDDNGEPQCVIKNPRKDTVSREVLRHPEFADLVQLSRIRDHFIYKVESVGQYNPEELVPEAINILLAKITQVEEGLDKLFAADAA